MDDKGCVAAWRALLQAENAVLRAIEADMDRAGVIPLTWYDVLLELKAAPGGRLRMQDLAARTVLSRTRVSRLVDEIETNSLVSRQPDPDDGRASFAVISQAGRGALKAAAPIYLAGIEAHFTGQLSPTERTQVTRALNKVVVAHQPHEAAKRR